MSEEEYEMVREGLLALMCIGDKIRGLHRVSTGREVFFLVDDEYVEGIHDDGTIGLFIPNGFHDIQPLTRFEIHEGIIYSLSASVIYNVDDRQRRIALIDIVLRDSKTRFKVDNG
jgi:hypothetical protein